jgi:hypothetical protein
MMKKTVVIPATWELPDAIKIRFGEKAGRQRSMFHEGHLLLILHTAPEPEENDRNGVLFWKTSGGDWLTTAHGNGLAALESHIGVYHDRIEDLDQSLDITRDAAGLFKILSSVAPILRAAKNMTKALQSARELTGNDREIITLRDEAEMVEQQAELLWLESKNALDFDIAKRAEEQSEQSEEISLAAHRLNLLAAIFFPITAIASVLGVSIETGLEGWLTPLRFWLVMAMSLGFGVLLKGLLAPRARRR